MIWGRAVRAGARSAARGAASHVATGAARSRADAWVWGASAFSPGACGASGLGRGSARGGSEAAGRARQPARGAESSAAERSRAERGWGRPGLRSEVQPRATCKCLGAQPPPLVAACPLSPAARRRLGPPGRGGCGPGGAEAAALFYLQVSRTPRPGSTPSGSGGGEAGTPRTPGSRPAAAASAGLRGWGDGLAVCPQVRTLPAGH